MCCILLLQNANMQKVYFHKTYLYKLEKKLFVSLSKPKTVSLIRNAKLCFIMDDLVPGENGKIKSSHGYFAVTQ